jgi:Skp family chaperone for outer membrane proteins
VQRHAAIITTNGFRNDMAGLVRDIRDIVGVPVVRRMVAGGLGIAAVALAFAGGAALFQYVSFKPAPSGLNVMQETNLQAAEAAKVAEARRAADLAKADAEAKRAAAEADAKAQAEQEAARRQADAAAKAKREQAEAAARQKQEEEARAKAERQRLAALQAEAKAAASQPLTDPTLLKEVRARLYALNFDPGPLEGSEPALTERAIREFEAQVRVAETGRPTSALLERLRAVPEPRPWGAIVYARTSEKWGMAWGQQTRKEAVASARSTCSERSAECAVEVSFFGSECAAFAHSTASWAITARNGIAEAKEAALADCKKRGEGCRIIASVCANGGERFGVK